MASVQAVDQYSRFMTEMFDERSIIGVTTVFQSFFGRPEHGSKTIYSPNASVVEIDILRGNERIAALIERGSDARQIRGKKKDATAQEYTNFARVYPLAEETANIGAKELINRTAGENPYMMKAQLDRLRTKALEYHLEHMRRFTRLFEYLAMKSILTGKMPAILGTTNTDLIYDFRRNGDNFITVTKAWDQTGSKPIEDIDNGSRVMRINGKVKPNVLLMAEDVMTAFLKNTETLTLSNKLNYNIITVGPNQPVPPQLMPLINGGATCRGLLITPAGYELWLMTYIGIYTDDNGDPQDFLPKGTALLAYYGARCDRYFGPGEALPVDSQTAAWYQEMFGFNMMAPPVPPNINNAQDIISPAMFYNDAFKTGENKHITIRTQTAPIFATTMTDAFVVLSGVTTISS